MPTIFRNYLYPRYIMDILVQSFIPLIAVSILAARIPLGVELLVAVFVNYIAYAFAFLYNDIEDRVEDANSPGKRFKNPFGYQVWSLSFGYSLLLTIAAASLLLSWLIGGLTLTAIAASNLAFGYLYSSKVIRLKGMPVVDILSHCYLLAGVTILYFLQLPGAGQDSSAWFLLVGAMLISAAGDALNEYRDFEEDMTAGLRNTASIIGKQNTRYLMYLLYVLGGLTTAFGIVSAVSTLL